MSAKSILESIIAAKFIANDAQVEELAALVATGVQGMGTYLRVVVAHTQQEMGGTRKTTKASVLAIVKGVHERLYVAVLKGVADETVATPERNRRATFARSAVSTLRKYISRGGDVRKLEPAETTKAKLRNFGRRVPTGTRVQRSLRRAADAVLRAAKRLVKQSPDDARKRLTALRAEIDAALAGISMSKVKHNKRGKRRAPVATTRPNGQSRGVHAPGMMH